MHAPALRAALTETRAVLEKASAAWSRHSCPGTSECCQLTVTGRPPWLWPTEWQLLLDAVKTLPAPRADGGCPFLEPDGKRCTVYAARPLGCRTFFCHRIRGPAAEPAAETNALLERLGALNLAFDDEAKPRALPDWHQAAYAGNTHPSRG